MDSVCKALVFNGLVEVTAFDTTDLVREAARIHNTSPVATVAFGKVLSIASFMSNSLKNKGDKLSITVDSEGDIGRIVVASNGAMNVRGFVENPNVAIEPLGNGKQNVKAAIKGGYLKVIKDLGLKDPYSGTSELVNGNVDEDFAWYFTKSEGVPTALALSINVDESGECTSAGGIVIQPMPGCTEEILVILEDISMNFVNIDKYVARRDPHQLIDDHFGHFEIEYFEPQKPEYKCTCNQEYIKGVVRSLGRNECVNILMERGSIEVVCQFCNKKYNFDKQAVIDLWQEYDRIHKKK